MRRRRKWREEEVKRKMRLVVVDTDATKCNLPLLWEDCQADGNSKGQTETQSHRTVTTGLLW